MTGAWNDLPQQVRIAVEQHVGPMADTTEITDGQNSDIAIVLHVTSGRPVFLKCVHGISRRMRWLRNEIAAGQLAVGIAPAVLFHVDVDGWLAVGFEYVSGRAASLAPGSPDLPHVASVLEKISSLPAPGLRSMRDRWSVTDWWSKLADEAPNTVTGWDVDDMSRWAALLPERLDGDRLLHTDLHGDQILIGPDGVVHVIDWGFPGAGAAWIDAAFLVLRLVEAGHRPDAAEAWARSLSCFSGVSREMLTAFAVYVAGLWSYWAATATPGWGAEHRARFARSYAAWRLGMSPTMRTYRG